MKTFYYLYAVDIYNIVASNKRNTNIINTHASLGSTCTWTGRPMHVRNGKSEMELCISDCYMVDYFPSCPGLCTKSRCHACSCSNHPACPCPRPVLIKKGPRASASCLARPCAHRGCSASAGGLAAACKRGRGAGAWMPGLG